MELQFVLLKYWYKVYSMPNHRIPKLVLIWDRKLGESGKKTWSSLSKYLLDELDCRGVHVDNADVFCNTIWDALASQALANWRREVQETGTRGSESGGKLANYRQFKFFPKTEPYVRLNLPATVRVVAGLRAGCLHLQIELGCFTQPKTPGSTNLPHLQPRD